MSLASGSDETRLRLGSARRDACSPEERERHETRGSRRRCRSANVQLRIGRTGPVRWWCRRRPSALRWRSGSGRCRSGLRAYRLLRSRRRASTSVEAEVSDGPEICSRLDENEASRAGRGRPPSRLPRFVPTRQRVEFVVCFRNPSASSTLSAAPPMSRSRLLSRTIARPLDPGVQQSARSRA
jgi:hypothetical protein